MVCDNHYLVLMAALIKSIEHNHKTGEQIDIIVVGDNVAESNKVKLEQSLDSTLISLRWITMREAVPANMKLPSDKSTYPMNIYTRVFIPWFVPESVTRVIYLDVDMIVTGDISELWYSDIDNLPLGAVQDPRIKTANNSWGGIKNYEQLGLAPDTKYFNTGMLIIDTEAWRSEHVANKVLECVANNQAFLNYPDQYALNVVLANKWAEIDPKWNHFVTSGETRDAKLIHFVERKPIYKSYSNSESYQILFYRYLNQTKWKSKRKIGEPERYLKKIGNLLYKLIKK